MAWVVGSLSIFPALASRGYVLDAREAPVAIIYALAVAAGVIGGALFKVRSRRSVIFSVCGAIAGLGSAFAVRAFVGSFASVPTLMVALIASAGAAPGIVVGWLFAENRE